MAGLIEELRAEHAEILSVFRKIKNADTKKGQEFFMGVKEALLSHIKKEDEELYSVLKKAAKNDKGLQKKLDFFAQDMELISTYALEYLEEQYMESDESKNAKNIETFMIILDSRIQREERLLFPEYDKLEQ